MLKVQRALLREVFLIVAFGSSIVGCSGTTSIPSANGSPGLASAASASPTHTSTPKPVPTSTPTSTPTATPTPAVGAADCTACWPTYAHDYQRTGFQAQHTGITESNVSTLTPRWAYPLNEQIVVSPVLDDGKLFIATGAGNVYAFNDATGSILWKRSLGGPILETPTIDHGLLFVGTHSPPSGFFALDITSGAVVWQTSIAGDFRGPAAVSNGIVYVGEAGGDPPLCDPGGVHAYQAATGAQLFFWRTDPNPQDGGAVWTPITIDGSNVVFGTGNTCSNGIANAHSLIRLTSAGTQEWEVPITEASTFDDDWGGAPTASGGRYYAANKNGFFFAIESSTGAVDWKLQLSPVDGQGSIGTPTTDGTVVIVPSGNLIDGNIQNPPTANFSAFSLSGARLWTYPFEDEQRNYAALADGIAYLAYDAAIAAVDARSGAKLWSYASSGGVEFVGSPAITPDGLFTADTDGAVIAFGPASSVSSAARSRIQIRRGPLYEPYGPIVQRRANGAYEVRY